MRIYQVAITVDYCEDHARITLGMTPNFNSAINMTKMSYGITQENWKDIVIFPQSNVKVVYFCLPHGHGSALLSTDVATPGVLCTVQERHGPCPVKCHEDD